MNQLLLAKPPLRGRRPTAHNKHLSGGQRQRKMSLFGGVDGCKSGWIVICLEDKNNWDWKLCETIHEVIEYTSQTALTLIDMPIGLKNYGLEERICDKAARILLGYPRMFSVFRVPPRPAVYASSYKDGCIISEQITGKKISKQTWGIVPKIKEIDTVFAKNPDLQNTIRETHPEVCFTCLSGSPMQHSKKTKTGITERLHVLKKVCPFSENIFTTLTRSISYKSALSDDIIDALAGALSAQSAWQKSVILGNNEVDPKNLRMEIVYGFSTDKINRIGDAHWNQ